MFRRQALFSLCALTSLAAFAVEPEKSPVPKPDAEEKLPEDVDPKRYARAAVVLRAKLIKPLGGETGVSWYRMKVLGTLKNTVRQEFGPIQDVFTSERPLPGVPRDPGPPAEECTIYLEVIKQIVGGEEQFHWRLLDGKSASGVSHIAK